MIHGPFIFVGTEAPGSTVELERAEGKGEDGGGILAFNPDAALSMARQRQRLPVYKVCVGTHGNTTM